MPTAEKISLTKRITKLENKGPLYDLNDFALYDVEKILKSFETSTSGLTTHNVSKRLVKYGHNVVAKEKRSSWPIRLFKLLINPLVVLLTVLTGVSVFTKDYPTSIIISIMIIISVGIRFFQENQAYNAAEALKSMVKTTCTVIRDGKVHEIHLSNVVPGDVIKLSAGDIIPADARVISSDDLFVNQSLLTGESVPVEKYPFEKEKKDNPLEYQDICFMGTNVESGSAEAVILATGDKTYFGDLAKELVKEKGETSFDKGIAKFTWLMIIFMGFMVPAVFFINWFGKGNWWEALMFAISVAVGLTPELLPALVTVNLTKGSVSLSKKKVIVKRLSSIQNFGAMDILCTDKTGTLTQNKVVLIKYIDIEMKDNESVLSHAYLNSFFQTGFKNLMDHAIIRHGKNFELESTTKKYEKIDELPFDFKRKCLSIIVRDEKGDTLVCKGAVEEVSALCTSFELGGKKHKMTKTMRDKIVDVEDQLSKDGLRVISVAKKAISKPRDHYDYPDEKDLEFLGFIAFLDPAKETAGEAVAELTKFGVAVKVLTGDNEHVTKTICKQVGIETTGILLGHEIEKMTDRELSDVVERTTIFAKLSPNHKMRIVNALQFNNHVVGFMGDGINDAPALRSADVGISVDTAVDIAKESADIILLEHSLMVLKEGIVNGRSVFANIIKYVKMGSSSNFGNMFSVLGASILLPYLPMTPLQLITNNLLYDISQTTIPTDTVDEEYVKKPRKWQIGDISKFMLFIGPVSSLFDYATFGVMWFILGASTNAALFQTGWFIESIMTQTLIVHVIRSRKIPFLQGWASKPLLWSTVFVMALAIYLVNSPIAGDLGFVSLPFLYWPLLVLILFSYILLTQAAKTLYIKKFGYN